jgi:hypothetical protein
MNALTALGEVNDRVQKMSEFCLDRTVKVKRIEFPDLQNVRIEGVPYPMRSLAQKSICYRLGIPFEYLRRCPAEIQSENLNYWIRQEKNERLFFRFKDMDVRAIFTLRYRPVDNFQVMDRLENLGYGPATKVQVNLDEEFLSLSIPNGRQTFEVNGDRIMPGISIANSEVGLSSLKISAFFLRLICTNGMVAKTEISAAYRHVSLKILDEFPTVMQEVSSQLSRQRDQFRLSIQSRVDDPLATIKNFSRQFQLGKLEEEAVDWGYGREPGHNMFSVVNAYTRAAQFPKLSAESVYRLQAAGGQILALVK